jgi:stage II sporulation protein D
VARLAPGIVATVAPRPGKVELRGAGPGARAEAARLIVSGDGSPVRFRGREYRGDVVLLRDGKGVTAINRVGVEEYLLGVVIAELGVKDPGDLEALKAQTIVSRTYALRNLGRWDADGFDVYASVNDQVYGGVGSESPLGRLAVDATRGQVLTYQDNLIDAFFSSTCAGRTVRGVDVFRGADRPYLRSIVDAPPNGAAYCSQSPRYAWREEWTGDVLRATLKRSLSAAAPVTGAEVDGLRDVVVRSTTPTGRVATLGFVLRKRQIDVEGPMVRQVLRPAGSDLLRSNLFTVTTRKSGGRVSGIVLDGHGAGHGVGFCQWGSIGRARAGQTAPAILAAYYAGTTITRRY